MQAISRSELKQMNEARHDDFVLINVLPPEAFNREHIRTSVNIPLQDDGFEQLVEKVAGNKQRKIVVYCASHDCDASLKAARRLEEAGFKQVYDYEGGSQDWFEQRQGTA